MKRLYSSITRAKISKKQEIPLFLYGLLRQVFELPIERIKKNQSTWGQWLGRRNFVPMAQSHAWFREYRIHKKPCAKNKSSALEVQHWQLDFFITLYWRRARFRYFRNWKSLLLGSRDWRTSLELHDRRISLHITCCCLWIGLCGIPWWLCLLFGSGSI